MDQAILEANLNMIKDAGFDGVEMQVPCDSAERDRLGALLNEIGLDLVAQVRAEGATVDEQIVFLEKKLSSALGLNTLLTNVHCGKDYWPLAENTRVISIAQRLAGELGIKILHETHRARATFCTTSATDIIDALPEIRFTADFSHWCCVHNTLLQDQQDSVNRVIERSDYIHARVGSATSPQITDPRADEWREAVEAHVRWWVKIAEHHKNNNTEFLPVCSEFGPPDYMVILPSTGKPIADQWDINCYMKEMLKERLRHLTED
ncbi:MAG: sugar phosphate isomerase/epimerase [Candidatus Scalindua rubra]|uniref:Xylose isomerase-like TIM barrel n=1 Tax=Candidatus Scalindua brodae TaxID=237368 RepID=A0A0B0EIN9_9BACT|nr:MAG: Xylose isomerase-like TIM barrel [Candidatus Scalindua brodae]MBZ0110471.1 sugar phosphate isomerase/epimerase [Candidatus Scalindua rubra]TWU36306.1 Xylose isomerase-like TIM barrel [Candidatus Brocadiaceae bacterium S225]